ncbi:MAG TPA: hypothetical protein VKB46_06165 [Pyrinomonadaceae bacterium]|nr:hypothetical protein [Pyrinomonadaceae bacterium]
MEETRVRARRWFDWLVALSLAALSAGVVIWQNSRLAVLWDISYILENSYRISLGQVPYRDFPFPYAPLTFLTQAALIKLTGRVFFHHVIYCAVIGALATVVTWRILLRVLNGARLVRVLSLVLTAPLSVLGVYAIFPHPFYDSDGTFAILVCLLLLLRWYRTPNAISLSLICGFVLVLPIFIKQNVGLVFTASTAASLVLLLTLDVWRGRRVRHYFWLFAALVVCLAAALLLLHRIAGLQNYIQWTVRFAAQRRTPALGEMIGVYRDRSLKWWLLLILLGATTFKLTKAKDSLDGLRSPESSSARSLLRWFSILLLATPFTWPVIYLFLDSDSSERAERLVNLWPLVLLLSLACITCALIRFLRTGLKRAQLAAVDSEKSFSSELSSTGLNASSDSEWLEQIFLPLIIIATVHGAFMSQQLWGSTYALWPFFLILVATSIRVFFTPAAALRNDGGQSTISSRYLHVVALASLISLSLLIAGFFYIRSHERLDYADLDEGDLTRSNLRALRGLTTRGSWLPDFEELVAYADKNIPRDDGLLYLPGEDLFYYTTGRVPQFPVLMFDHTVNPYSPQEIVDLARARNIQWLIVKDDLQLEEEPLERKDELINLLEKDFESVDSLNNYEIYKRKSLGSDNSEDDDSDEPENK